MEWTDWWQKYEGDSMKHSKWETKFLPYEFSKDEMEQHKIMISWWDSLQNEIIIIIFTYEINKYEMEQHNFKTN